MRTAAGHIGGAARATRAAATALKVAASICKLFDRAILAAISINHYLSSCTKGNFPKFGDAITC